MQIGKDFILFDGAMGTMMQNKGLKIGELPELLSITKPDIIKSIHREYIDAGCDVITTNTFGANRLKLEKADVDVETVISQSVKIAKEVAGHKKVALDIGPLGKLMEPTGDLTFNEAYDLFEEQILAGKKAGADLVLLETFSDIFEMKAAILAVKENSSLPILCTMTFQEDGRTLMGTDPKTMIHTLQDMGIDAIGTNCSLGPKDMMSTVEEILKHATIPVMVQPNAGLPEVVDGETVFKVDIQEFVKATEEMLQKGVSIIGGCCGTNPNYIKELKNIIDKTDLNRPKVSRKTVATTGTKTVVMDNRVTIIGERVNPTGKKALKEALKAKDMNYILNEAITQVKCGAHVLDVNVGLPEIDEEEMMLEVSKNIAQNTDVPLQIDSSSPPVIEKAVRYYNGRPIINSVNGKKESMDAIFPIVKKYGATVIALLLDEKGLPKNAEERIAIADRMIQEAERYGIHKEQIIVDCLTLTVSAQQEAAKDTLKAMNIIKEKYGVKTTLGASNISFGLPSRKRLNSVFLAVALANGLDAPITDPTEEEYRGVIRAFEVLMDKDKDAKEYIEAYTEEEKNRKAQINEKTKAPVKQNQVTIKEEDTLKNIIIKGRTDKVKDKTEEVLKDMDALDVVNQHLIPSLEVVGQKYEKGEIFLPQLIKSAETVKKSFDVIKAKMKGSDTAIYNGKIVVATVKGDIHDIGKNIVKVLLENYGYEVIDLGKDVAIEEIVDTVKREKIKLVGLSALMTTTVKSMEETIIALRDEKLLCKVMVGGAVLNEDYARNIGADYYCKDGISAVRVAERIFGEKS